MDGEIDLSLYHARFPAVRRRKIEATIRKKFGSGKNGRPGRAILIATQAAEQGCDIDADVLITSCAPADLLLQRIGRIHRHQEVNCLRPKALAETHACILVPDKDGDFGVNARVYPECLLRQSQRIFESHPILNFPADIPVITEEG